MFLLCPVILYHKQSNQPVSVLFCHLLWSGECFRHILNSYSCSMLWHTSLLLNLTQRPTYANNVCAVLKKGLMLLLLSLKPTVMCKLVYTVVYMSLCTCVVGGVGQFSRHGVRILQGTVPTMVFQAQQQHYNHQQVYFSAYALSITFTILYTRLFF